MTTREKVLVGTLAIVTVIAIIFAVGCDSASAADKKQQAATEQAMAEAERQIGMPAITNFQERRLAKMIFELRDQEDLVCYAYIFNQLEGKLVYVGQCIGFGLPYSIQYTSPEKLVRRHSAGERIPMPQADPNGLFMPSGLSATWLMMIDPETNAQRPVYFEPEIVVSPFPLH